MVNPHVSEARDAQVSVRGAKLKTASAEVLTHTDIHAHNTFAAEKRGGAAKTESAEIKGET